MLFCRHAYCRIFRALIALFLDPYCLFYIMSWFVIRYLRNADIIVPYLNNWLTDFVFIPLIFHAVSLIGLIIFKERYLYKFPLWLILFICFYCSFFFEVLAPRFTSYNTADWVDVLFYFLGGLFYYFVHQPYLTKRIAQLQTNWDGIEKIKG